MSEFAAPLALAAPDAIPVIGDDSLRLLTAGLAKGDNAAWRQFHREHGPAIMRQLLCATRGDYALASEALQQTYLRVARHARECAESAMFSAWLRRVAATALSDCRRRHRSFWALLLRRKAEPTEVCSAPEEDRFILRALAQALSQLPEEERQLLNAKYFHGDDVRTLAARLGVSAKAAESRLTRARHALRRQLLAALAQRHEDKS